MPLDSFRGKEAKPSTLPEAAAEYTSSGDRNFTKSIRIEGAIIPVRLIQQLLIRALPNDDEGGEDDASIWCDRGGQYYLIHWLRPGRRGNPSASVVRRLTGKEAMRAFVHGELEDGHFLNQFLRAIDAPEFEFMPEVPATPKPKRKRKAKAAQKAEVFHEQLHLATALVECVRKLAAAPSLEKLANACRSASAVHQAIHAPENFKLAANS